jgi:hypothetical protein
MWHSKGDPPARYKNIRLPRFTVIISSRHGLKYQAVPVPSGAKNSGE